MLRSIQALCLVALVGLLVGCGGSGGSSDDNNESTPVEPCPTTVECAAGDELCGRTYNSISLNPASFILNTSKVIFRGESQGACSEPHPDAGRNSFYRNSTFPYEIMGSGIGLEIDGAVKLSGAYKDDASVVALGVKAPGQTEAGLTVMLEEASGLTIHDVINSTYFCTGVLFTGIGEWLEAANDLASNLPPGVDPSNIVTDWLVSGQLIFGQSNRDVLFSVSGRTTNADGEIETQEFLSFSPETGEIMEVSEDGFFKFPLNDELTGAEGFVDQTREKLILRSDGVSPLMRFFMLCQKEGVDSPIPSGTFLKTFLRRKAVLADGGGTEEYTYTSGVSQLTFTGASTLARSDLSVSDNVFVGDATTFYEQQYKWIDSDGSLFIDEDLDTQVPGNDFVLREEPVTYFRMSDSSDEIIERRIPVLVFGYRESDYDYLYELGIAF